MFTASMWLRSSLLALLIGCATAPPLDLSNATLPAARPRVPQNTHVVREVVPDDRALEVLAQKGRSDADRALDAPRQSADLLTFIGVRPGERVAVIGAGTGYFTELLARAVGPGGLVIAQNAPRWTRPSVAQAWQSRLSGPAMANVVALDRGFDAPLRQQDRQLDLVYLGPAYSTLVGMGVDRQAIDHAAHLALDHGGRYVVLDVTQRGSGSAAAEHRDESRSVRREIESVGFTLASEGRFLRTSGDPRDWDARPSVIDRPVTEASSSPKADVFVLVFVKP